MASVCDKNMCEKRKQTIMRDREKENRFYSPNINGGCARNCFWIICTCIRQFPCGQWNSKKLWTRWILIKKKRKQFSIIRCGYQLHVMSKESNSKNLIGKPSTLWKLDINYQICYAIEIEYVFSYPRLPLRRFTFLFLKILFLDFRIFNSFGAARLQHISTRTFLSTSFSLLCAFSVFYHQYDD